MKKYICYFLSIIALAIIIRYVAYQHTVQWKQADFSRPIERKYDMIYEEVLKEPTNILAHYDMINIDSFKEGYNTGRLRKYFWSNAIDVYLELGNIKDNLHLLDIGCGTGMHAIYYCRKFSNIYVSCIINTKNLYEKTYRNIKKANLLDRITVYLMDMDHLVEPVLSQRFDRIFMIESVGYSKNRKKLFDNLYSLLNLSGKLFITTPTISTTNLREIEYMISLWQYNFSTLQTILSDLKQYNDVQYISLSSWKKYIFINPLDLYYIYRFNKINNSKVPLLDFNTSPLFANQFIICSK